MKRVLRVGPNYKIPMSDEKRLARDYHVEMCILTDLGILVARGFLYIPRDQGEAVDPSSTKTIQFTNCHINWNSWGFDAERRWVSPWKFAHVGHPFR